MTGQAIAITMLTRNGVPSLPTLLRSPATLDPPPDKLVAVHSGSTDRSVVVATAAGLPVARCPRRRRAAGINVGAQVAAPTTGILHADTLLPPNAVALIRTALAKPSAALAQFTSVLRGLGGVPRGASFHNQTANSASLTKEGIP